MFGSGLLRFREYIIVGLGAEGFSMGVLVVQVVFGELRLNWLF